MSARRPTSGVGQVVEAGPALDPALVALVRRRVGQLPAERREAGWRRLAGRIGPWPRARRRGGLGLKLGLVAGFGATLATLVVALRPDAPPPGGSRLTYEVSTGRIAGGELQAAAAGARLAFSDGSALALAPASSGRVVALEQGGARFRLSRGRADLSITPRPDARWTVEAGPFLVLVRGTVFSVDWSEAEERLEVRLSHGGVEVTGPFIAGSVSLRPGQRLVARVREREARLLDAPASTGGPGAVTPPAEAPPTEAPPGEAPPAPRARDRARAAPVRVAARRPAPAPRPDWLSQLRAGRFTAVVADAEAQGLPVVYDGAAPGELATLADAARYARRNDVARGALVALRRRFPASTAAHDAAFHLGRMAEVEGGASAEAVRWYARYLDEAPRGTFAAEALGRQVSAVARMEGPDRARPLAEEYLRRFPAGDYAEKARALARKD